MKKIIFINILFCFISIIIHAQVEPSVTFDPETGNYIIEYAGYEGDLIEVIYEPETKIVPDIEALIYRDDNLNVTFYNYRISNNKSSKQRILRFCLEPFSRVNNITIPNNEWGSHNRLSGKDIIWWSHSLVRPDGIRTQFNGIAPDSSISGFAYQSAGIPTIIKSYFSGANKIPAFPDEPPFEIERILDTIDVFPYNTVQRLTIGPKDPPSPFIPSEFLDTLINYTTQSFELGWISDQTTHDKYLNYFNTAKTFLENTDTNSARNELLKVLTDVDIDSSTTLTSEAYALLKFNTEYLVERL